MSKQNPQDLPSFQKTKAKSPFWAMALKSLAVLAFLMLIFAAIYWSFGRIAFEELSRGELYSQVMRGQIDVRRMAALEWASKLQSAESRSDDFKIREYLPTPEEVTVLSQEIVALENSAKPDSELIAGILSVLGHSSSYQAQQSLRSFLQKPRRADWAKAQVQAVIGLSRQEPDDLQNLEVYSNLLSSSVDPSLRKAIAYALGFSSTDTAKSEAARAQKARLLEKLLLDEASDVRWNATFSALRLGLKLPAAYAQLRDLIEELKNDVGHAPTEERKRVLTQKRDTYLEALNLTQKIERDDALFESMWNHIKEIAHGHPDLKIRQSAKEALKTHYDTLH